MTHREALVEIYEDLAALDTVPVEKWREPIDVVIRKIDAHLTTPEKPAPFISWRKVLWVFFYGWIAAGYTYYANLAGTAGVFEAVGFTALIAVAVAVLSTVVTVFWNAMRKGPR